VGVSQRVDAILHPKDRVGVLLGHSIETMVVDAKAGRPVFFGDDNDRACPFTGTWSEDHCFQHPIDLVKDHVTGMVARAVRLLPYRLCPGLNPHAVVGGFEEAERPV